MIPRLFVVHVFVLQALFAGFLAMHMGILWYQRHAQFPGRLRREDNVVGQRLWPSYTAKTLVIFFAVFALLAALGGLAQINPIWLYGPYVPEAVTTASQPDWYLGWVEGALRLFPSWEIEVGGYLIANRFVPRCSFRCSSSPCSHSGRSWKPVRPSTGGRTTCSTLRRSGRCGRGSA